MSKTQVNADHSHKKNIFEKKKKTDKIKQTATSSVCLVRTKGLFCPATYIRICKSTFL